MDSASPVTMDSFEACFRRVTLPMGLVADEVKIEGAATNLSTSPFSVHLDWPATVEAHVAALDLAEFLNAKAPGGIRDFAIAIRDGQLFIEATTRMIVEVRAKVVCTLRIQDGKRLFVDLESVDVMGVGAKGLVQSHLDQINPVMDVTDLPLSVNMDRVVADHDRIVLYGTATP